MKRIWLAILAMLAASTAWAQQPLWSQPKYAAIVVDATDGQVLYERRADLARHPASITKVMTLMLAFDAVERGDLKLSDSVVMTANAHAQPPSKLGLLVGQSIPVEDAIRVIAVKSANDVAVALAERIAGNEAAFVTRMNAKAKALGMTGTNFANASGLPNPAHYTTARDLATLAMAMLKQHPRDYAYFSTPAVTWAGKVMQNHNHLLGQVPGVDGIKTGYTVASGYTLAASAVRGGRRLIAVVLGSPTGRERDGNVSDLLNAGFSVVEARRWGGNMTIARALGEAEDGVVRLATRAPDTIGDLIASHGPIGSARAQGAPMSPAQPALSFQRP